MESSLLIVSLIGLNILLFLYIRRVLFKDWEELWEAVQYTLIPNFLSFLFGELHRDWWLSVKFVILVALCGLLLYGEYMLFQ